MSEKSEPVSVLSERESFRLLGTQVLGRVVSRVGDVVDIFPVNFVVDDGDIVLRTAPGTKLTEMLIGPEVLFEADHVGEAEAWSVIVRGTARVLETSAEIEAADALPLVPMVPTMKWYYVRITPGSVSGRAFELGEEPRRDGPQEY